MSQKKVKLKVKNKEDSLLYLGHLIEYVEKKQYIFNQLIIKSIKFLESQVEYNGIKIKAKIDYEKLNIDNYIVEFLKTKAYFNIDFYDFKLYISAPTLARNEIVNVIGDYGRDKRSFSYNNFLHIINDIPNIELEDSTEKSKLIDEFQLARNYINHFSGDKVVEWIKFRKEQIKENKEINFEMGFDNNEFNVYMPEYISSVDYLTHLGGLIKNYRQFEKVINFMKKDYEKILNKSLLFNIKFQKKLDSTFFKISKNGMESHIKTNKK